MQTDALLRYATPPTPLAASLASELFADVAKASSTVGELMSGDVYRLVGGVDDLASVAGNPDLFRGFQLRPDGKIQGHGEFASVGKASVGPAIALSVASAALGCYWQQQVNAQLSTINAKIDELLQFKLDEIDADLSFAEEEIDLLLLSYQIGDHPTPTPGVVGQASRIAFHYHYRISRRADETNRWTRGIPLNECIKLSDQLLPDIVRFHRAFVVDTQITRLKLLQSESIASPLFRDRVLAHGNKRRQMLGDVQDVLRPVARARLKYDKPGVGEHLSKKLHRTNLRSRRTVAEYKRQHAALAAEALDYDMTMVPDPTWWPQPHVVELRADRTGAPTADLALLETT